MALPNNYVQKVVDDRSLLRGYLRKILMDRPELQGYDAAVYTRMVVTDLLDIEIDKRFLEIADKG